jgi:putative membrane protein
VDAGDLPSEGRPAGELPADERRADELLAVERRFPDASRRTYFAEERTLLAWWRSGIAAAAVALGVGAILPKLGDEPRARFVALGIGYGLLAVIFVVGGSLRDRQSRRALATNGFAEVPGWVVAVVTAYLTVLVVLTVVAVV